MSHSVHDFICLLSLANSSPHSTAINWQKYGVAVCALCHTATVPFAYRLILVQFSQLRQFLREGEAILATRQHMHSLTIPLSLFIRWTDWRIRPVNSGQASEQNIAKVHMASEWYEVSNKTISKWSTDTIVGTEKSWHTTWANNKWHNHWLQSEHCATLSHIMLSSKVNIPCSFILMHILIYTDHSGQVICF